MCQLCNVNVEQAEMFAENMLDVFNKASLSIMISIGHRSKLFDMMSASGEITSQELAKNNHLNERYVREWLAAMSVGEIVIYNPNNKTYLLPTEHAAFLTRPVGSDNFATLFQYIPVMANVEDQLLACFKNGGGVPYEKFNRFHEVMAEDSGQNFKSNLITQMLPLMDGMIEKLGKGISVLDIGCGSGTAINTLAKVFPNSTFSGIDFCKEPLEQAVKDCKMLKLDNATFLKMDAVDLDFYNKFDLITTFDAIHDQVFPDKVLKNIYNNLNEGGTYLMMDIDASSNLEENLEHPLAPALYSMSTAHCMTVSLAKGGMGLGTMWGRQKAQEMLKEAGFKSTIIKRIEDDIVNAYYISVK